MKEKTGLWKRTSKKGVNYYSGKIKIGDKEYQLAIFKNDKQQEKQPDLMLYVKEGEKKEKKSYTTDEMVYADFGNEVNEIPDSEIAF